MIMSYEVEDIEVKVLTSRLMVVESRLKRYSKEKELLIQSLSDLKDFISMKKEMEEGK
jgi:hypothetical protein